MKVAKFRKLLKEQSDKMRIKGVGAKFTREGIIVEAAIGNEMRKVNSFFTIIKNFLVNEGIKVDRMNISKTNRTQFSKFMINEAVYVEQEDQEDDELVPTDVNDDEIPDETEAYVDGIVDSMSDVEYTDYVMGSDSMVSDGIPDDEDAIEIVLADDIDSLETDIVDEVEEGEVKVVDINAHNGEGAISERRRVRGRMIKEGGREKMSPRPFVKTKKLINESGGGDPDAFKLHIDLINAIYDNPNATAKMIAKELNMPNDVDMIQKAIDIVYPNRRALAEPEDELNESRKQLNEYFVREGDTVEDALAQINLFNDMIFDPQEYNDFYGKKEYAEKAKSIYNEFNEFKNIKINSDEEYFIENMIYDGTDAYGEGYDDDLKNIYDDQIEQLGELLEMLKNRELEDELNEASTPSGRGEEYMIAIGREWMNGEVDDDHDEYGSIKKIKFSVNNVEEAIAYVYAMSDIAYQSTIRKPSRDELNEWLSNNSFSPEDPNFEVILDEINEKFAEEHLAVVSLKNMTTGVTLIEDGNWKGPKNGKGWITKDEFDSPPGIREKNNS